VQCSLSRRLPPSQQRPAAFLSLVRSRERGALLERLVDRSRCGMEGGESSSTVSCSVRRRPLYSAGVPRGGPVRDRVRRCRCGRVDLPDGEERRNAGEDGRIDGHERRRNCLHRSRRPTRLLPTLQQDETAAASCAVRVARPRPPSDPRIVPVPVQTTDSHSTQTPFSPQTWRYVRPSAEVAAA
jgi:hypothetical protein